jgi:zinc/manganese transport system substrate-binding protein
MHAVGHVADHIADELGRAQPEKAADFHRSAEQFRSELDGLQGRVQDIAARQQGKKVLVTEPVAHYLIEQSRLEDITPQSFVNAVEAENDPSAASVAEIQNAVNSRQAAAMVYNPQTESRVTQGIRDAALRNGTPVVEMTETLPPGKTYQQWMSDQISALDGALGQRR